jgi:hypothetical protein
MPARLTPQQRIWRAMSEKQLADKMLQLAEATHWWWHHTRPAWTPKGFRTPLGGMVGFVDYVLAKWPGRVLYVELKTQLGEYGPGQEEWMRRLEPTGCYRLWRPSDWNSIERELRS